MRKSTLSRLHSLIAVASLPVLAVAGCTGMNDASDVTASVTPGGTLGAANADVMANDAATVAWIDALKAQFQATSASLPMGAIGPSDTEMHPLIRESFVEHLTSKDGVVSAQFVERGVGVSAAVKTGELASSAFTVEHRRSGMSVQMELQNASDAKAANGYLVWKSETEGEPSLIRQLEPEGAADYFHFAAKPAKEQVDYTLSIDARVTALTLANNRVLGFVDALGETHLRIEAPLLVDAKGEIHRAVFEVEGCAVNTDVEDTHLASLNATLTTPGATSCTLRVLWGKNDPIAHPALLDPAVGSSRLRQRVRLAHRRDVDHEGQRRLDDDLRPPLRLGRQPDHVRRRLQHPVHLGRARAEREPCGRRDGLGARPRDRRDPDRPVPELGLDQHERQR